MILEVEGIRFSYGKKEILDDVCLKMESGDVISILGPNGSGKTTLLRCIEGIVRPSAGTVTIDGDDSTALGRREIAKRIGYVPQRAESHRMTVFQSVLLGRRPYITIDASEKDERIADNVIRLFGLERISQQFADEISGGELQMVQIARTVVQHPKIILLDEPTNNLDPSNQQKVLDNLRKVIKRNGMSMMMVEHDLNLAVRYSDKFILMKGGQVYAAGGIEVLTPENIKAVYDIDVFVETVHGVTVIIPVGDDPVEDFLSKRKRNPKQKEFFNDRAGVWDKISIHDQSKVEEITNLLGIKEDSRILDVGTGTGVMIPHYLDRIITGKVTAVDYSENMIEVAKAKYPESERLEYRAMDIYDLKDSKAFDIVVCYSCFPHFPDPIAAVRVLTESLKDGGLFCIAHSSSKEHINHVHQTGGEEICTDYLPEMDVMRSIYVMNGLEMVYTRDDDDYYIAIGRKL